MPVVRYRIRNEYGLADPELYRAADQDDPEALLEGVAMAGLVGVLRQLGDLAEFAAEIFHELHEEVMATAARGHGLKLRVQQLEADFPSVEKAFLSQTNHSHFGYNAGIYWHANLRTDKNLITRGDMPRFILDSYEECRGPPRLFMLDKFDVAGAGACLKRYSDPSFFRTELASSGIMEAELQREKKGRKIKKKLPRWKNGKVVDTSLATYVKSDFQPDKSEPIPEKPPTRRVKLKSMHLDVVDTNNRTSYMKGFLEVLLAEEKVVQEYPKTHSIRSADSCESAPDIHEIVIDNSYNFPSYKERNYIQPLLPTNEPENQNIKSEEFFEALPEPLNKVENMHSIFKIVEEDGISVKSEDKTDSRVDSNRSSEVEKDAQVLLAMYQKKILSEDECTEEGYRSDDICSDVDNFMDALNTIESETEADSESRAKLHPGFSNKDSRRINSNNDERQHELPWQSSESKFVEKSKIAMSMRNNIITGIPSLHEADNITMTQSTLRESESVEESKTAMSMRNNIITGISSLHEADDITMTQSSLRESESVEESKTAMSMRNSILTGMPGLRDADNITMTQSSLRESESVEDSKTAMSMRNNIITGIPSLHDADNITTAQSSLRDIMALEDLHRNSEVIEFESPVRVLSEGSCSTEAHEGPRFRPAIREATSCSSVMDSTSSLFHILPQGSSTEANSTSSDSSEISSFAKNDHKVGKHLDNNLPCMTESSTASKLDDIVGLSLANGDVSGKMYPAEPEDSTNTINTPCDVSQKQDDSIPRCFADHIEDLLLPEPDSWNQDTEASETGNLSTSSAVYPADSSFVVQPDGLTAEKECLGQAEVLDSEIFPESVRATQATLEVSEQLDGRSSGDYVPEISQPIEDEEVVTEKLDGLEHLTKAQNIVALENVPDGYVEDSILSPTMSIGEPEVMMEKLDVLEHLPEAQNIVALENVPDGYVEDSTLSPTMSIGEPEAMMEKLDLLGHLPEAQNLVALENVPDGYVGDSTLPPTMCIGEPEVMTEKLDVLELLPEAQSLVALENVPDRYVEDSTLSPTMSIGEPEVSSEHDAESCSGGNLSQNALANSPFIDYAGVPPAGVDEEADDFVASGEVLASSGSAENTENADYVINAKISDPNILTLELELLSNGESLDDKGVELEDHVPSSPEKTTLPGNSQVQSTYEVTDVTHPISDDFGLPIGCTESALHHVSEQIDNSSSKILTTDTVVDHDEPPFVHSPEISGFDGKSQEDVVSSDAYPNQQSLDTEEASSPTNAELLYSGSTLYSSLIPEDGNLSVSAPAATSSDLCSSKLSDSSDTELPNGVCHTMSYEHSETPMDPAIDEDGQLCSVESEGDFSPGPFRSCTQESEKDETSSFVHPVMPDEESSKENPDDESEMSPSQEGELLVPSDLQSETIRVVEQEGTPNSVEFDGKPTESGPEQESDTVSTGRNICELDIPATSNTDTLWQLELEASVPSECSFVHPVNSSPPNATSENGKLLFVAEVGPTSTESTTEQFSEPSTSSDTVPSPQIQDTEEAPPLPPLPPLEWRMGKLRLSSSASDGSFSQPLFGTNLFSAPLIEAKAETIQPANMSVTLPSTEESKPRHTSLNSENKRLQPLKLSELPPIMGDRQHIYSHNALQGGMLPPSNPFAPFQFLENEASQLYSEGERNQPLEDSRPQLGQSLPALGLERYQHAEPNKDTNGLQLIDPFLIEDDKYQYNVGGYSGENLQYPTLSPPLPTKEPMMPHHGYVSSTEGHSHMLEDDMLHTMEDLKPNRKFPSIRDLPRHPLIDAVAAHDKTKLRKVSELVQPSTKPKADRDTLLEQIRNKSFNLKPASATKPNIKGPRTNLKVAAILEKANAIRQACAGSDEDDDGDSWSDS